MNESDGNKYSAFMDGEAELDVNSLKELTNNPELKQQWHRYHLMRDVMHQQYVGKVEHSWYESLLAKLEQEPVVFSPRRKHLVKYRIFKQVAGFAVAATVAIVAIFIVRQSDVEQQPGALKIASVPTQTLIRPVTLRVSKAVESKLNGYLVNHYEYSMTGKIQGVLPYMRIVSVTPTLRVVNEK